MQADNDQARTYGPKAVKDREGVKVFGNGPVTRLIADRSLCMGLAREHAAVVDSGRRSKRDIP